MEVQQVGKYKDRDELIEKYQRYVNQIVGSLVKKLGLPSRLYDEFVASGYLGLVEAADRYDPTSGHKFKTYAFLRIRGAIIDDIRRNSELSPNAYRYAKALNAANALREDLDLNSETPSEGLAKVLDILAKGAIALRVSFQDVETELNQIEDPNVETPEVNVGKVKLTQLLLETIAKLPEKERQIIHAYYFEDKPFNEIAEEIEGASKSWVSRLHTRALSSIKESLCHEFAN